MWQASIWDRQVRRLDISDLPQSGERYRLPTGPIAEVIGLAEDDMEVRLRYVIDGQPQPGPENVVGFTLAWLRKHAAPLEPATTEN